MLKLKCHTEFNEIGLYDSLCILHINQITTKILQKQGILLLNLIIILLTKE